MACIDKIAQDILNSCDIVPRAGFESKAWILNRTEIDVITFDGAINTLVENITIDSDKRAYTVEAVKKEMNGGFDLVTADDIPDSYLQYFAFKPYEQDAASVKNFDDMNDLVIIAEQKGAKTEGCFVIYGLEKGLYKSSGNQRGQEGFGLPVYEMQSLEGQGERYSRFVFWNTDYATTKAILEILTPELVVNGDFATDTVWAKGSGVTISAGAAHLAATPVGAALTQSGILAATTTYRVVYTILNFSAEGARVVVGGTNGTTRTANGTYTEDIVSAAGTDLVLEATGTATLDIDNVSCKEVI